jgi:hypothetical protein
MLEITADALTKEFGSIRAVDAAPRCGLAFTRPEARNLNTARRGRADPAVVHKPFPTERFSHESRRPQS